MRKKHRDKDIPRGTAIGRRALIKMAVGGGVAVAQLNGPKGFAQGPAGSPQERAAALKAAVWTQEERYAGVKMHTGPGWKNDSNRASGNGPMDETSRQIVKYVSGFSEANLTPALV